MRMALGKVIVAPQKTFLILNILTSALLLTSALARLSEDLRVVRVLGNLIFLCIHWPGPHMDMLSYAGTLLTVINMVTHIASVGSVTVWGQNMKPRAIDNIYHNKLHLVTFEK